MNILSAQHELAHEYFVCHAKYTVHIKTACEVKMLKEVSDQMLVALAPLFGLLFLGLITARRRSRRWRQTEDTFSPWEIGDG
jgi:hypothetical protein